MIKLDKQPMVIIFSGVLLFLFLWITESLIAYGGGGGEDTVVTVPPVKLSTIVREYTREELEEFFSGLPEGVKDLIIDKQEGKPRTPAQLNLIRNIFQEAEHWQHQSEEAIWQSYEEVAIVLDQAGQHAELVLALTSGGTSSAAVQLITGTLFGATRSGINAVNDGKSTEEVLQAIAVSVTVDRIMGADGIKKMTDRGGRLVDMVSRAADLNKNPEVTKYLIKVGTKAGLYKAGEKLSKDAITAILNHMANQARKADPPSTRAPMTTYMGPGGYDVDMMGQKLYK